MEALDLDGKHSTLGLSQDMLRPLCTHVKGCVDTLVIISLWLSSVDTALDVCRHFGYHLLTHHTLVITLCLSSVDTLAYHLASHLCLIFCATCTMPSVPEGRQGGRD